MVVYCNCEKCISCCENIPGIFKVNEVKKAANFLHLSLQDFFEKILCIRV